MIWSVSKHKAFRRCQRQWFYSSIYKSHASKDQRRYNAYLLSKLQSIYAWRGSIVDKIISEEVIWPLNRGVLPKQGKALEKAKEYFEAQLEFAQSHTLFGSRIRPSDHENFAALFPFEYGEIISEEDLAKAWDDISTAIKNFYSQEALILQLSKAIKLIPQRALSYQYYGQTVRAVPDLIAFFLNQGPLIVDWKVHTFGTTDAWFQLGCYAIAIVRCNSHKDFPSKSRINAEEVDLIEVQLLKNQQRIYRLNTEDINKIGGRIAQSIDQMNLVLGDIPRKELQPIDFLVTKYPSNCKTCSFRMLCWENEQWQELKQISFL